MSRPRISPRFCRTSAQRSSTATARASDMAAGCCLRTAKRVLAPNAWPTPCEDAPVTTLHDQPAAVSDPAGSPLSVAPTTAVQRAPDTLLRDLGIRPVINL